MGIIKDFYEAYIIYQFLSFCISAIGGGDRNKVIDLLAKNVDHLTPPFKIFFCCKTHYEDDRALASAILLQCQLFAMQFVFWKPVTAISMVMLKKYNYFGPYAEDATDWKSFQFWIVIIQNISTFVAFSGLLKFYHAVDKELAWCRPLAKFLCIKGVVFMTFWQGSALTILAETTDVGGGGDAGEWSEQIQNFLICMEMLLFSIAHFYCFPIEEWQPGYKVNYRKAKFGETLALNDFFSDLKIIMTNGNHSKKKKKKHSKEPTESTIPEEDGETATVDDSESALDEDDTTDALVRALASGIESYEDDEDSNVLDVSVNEEKIHNAQKRLDNMLGEMLFSPARPRTVDRGASMESNNIDEDEEEPNGVDEENGIVDLSEVEEEEEQIVETTGLLTGEESTSLTNNLRPSIFTTISQQQTPGEVDEEAGYSKEE